ncbi:MAG: aminopeptidase [Clostridia bacterium]|nr:aminopeptidase [Clostridia bacterium]
MKKNEKEAASLAYKTESAAKTMSEKEIRLAFDFAKGYMDFINKSKTERDAVREILNKASAVGYTPYVYSKKYKPGEKVFFNNRSKAAILVIFGKKTVDNGVKIMASHIDSPRLDLKPSPLYEEGHIGFFKTHYYGGIKKYQWPTIQLALHGTVVRADGTSVDIEIGEDENDPVFYVNDLLPHLDRNLAQKKASDFIPAESLNLVAGSLLAKDEEKDPIKLNILSILKEKYDICEEDLLTSELCAVPAAKARDVGLDRSMIAAYAHDDKVCAYPSLAVMLEADKTPEYTTVCVFADKEETGSNSNTGLDTNYLYDLIADIADTQKVNVRKTWYMTKCLSADVNACYDPNFPEVFEKLNSAYINHGVVLTKYTGGGGKSSTNDATAEFFAEIRGILNRDKVCWQSAELGKTDVGGGGTVAKYIAKLNADVIDIGVPVLSMHAPVEVISKLDLYSTYLAFKAFCKD